MYKQKLKESDDELASLRERLFAAEEFIGQDILKCVSWNINETENSALIEGGVGNDTEK